MQKLPEAPNRKWGWQEVRVTGSGASLRKGEIRSHFGGTVQAERMFSHSAASKVARLFAKSPGSFACRLCLLLASRHAEKSKIKAQLDMITLNLDLLTTGDN